MVTSWGRLFHSGMVLGKSHLSIWYPVGRNVVGEVVGVPGGSPGVVGFYEAFRDEN